MLLTIIFSVFLVLIIIIILLSRGRYEKELESLDSRTYSLKALLPAAIYLLEKINYKFSTKYDRNLLNKYIEVSGRKNAGFYARIHAANLICYLITGLAVVLFTSCIVSVQEAGDSNKRLVAESNQIKRPAYGSGDLKLQLEAELKTGRERAKEVFDLPVKEMLPVTEDEKTVARIAERLSESSIIGRNNSSSNICSELSLPSNGKSFGEPEVRLSWLSGDESILGSDGKVTRPQYGAGNKTVILQVSIKKGKALHKKNFKLTVIQSDVPLSDRQKIAAAGEGIRQKISEGKNYDNSGNYVLPTEIDKAKDVKINWSDGAREENHSTEIVLFLGLIIVAAVIYLKDNELNKKIKLRRQQLQYDFPDFLNRFTLLVNAGMPVTRAWVKISQDAVKTGPLYNELSITLAEINSGISEITAYENFAGRCRITEITKFVSIIEQNLRKGNKELVAVLRLLVNECWQIRKNNAKRLGEEASTKMLLPLMLMFLAIVLIVAAPAVMAIKSF